MYSLLGKERLQCERAEANLGWGGGGGGGCYYVKTSISDWLTLDFFYNYVFVAKICQLLGGSARRKITTFLVKMFQKVH